MQYNSIVNHCSAHKLKLSFCQLHKASLYNANIYNNNNILLVN